jgi:uncharacterized membrane protein YkvA (DUF1232 family)
MTDYEDTAEAATRVDPEKFERDKARVEAGFWPKVKRVLGQVSFVEDAVAAYYCARDPETPFRVKAVLMGALAYFVLPVDVVPDFLVAIGLVDDAAVLAYAFRYVSRYVQPNHRERARTALHDLDPSDGEPTA